MAIPSLFDMASLQLLMEGDKMKLFHVKRLSNDFSFFHLRYMLILCRQGAVADLYKHVIRHKLVGHWRYLPIDNKAQYVGDIKDPVLLYKCCMHNIIYITPHNLYYIYHTLNKEHKDIVMDSYIARGGALAYNVTMFIRRHQMRI